MRSRKLFPPPRSPWSLEEKNDGSIELLLQPRFSPGSALLALRVLLLDEKREHFSARELMITACMSPRPLQGTSSRRMSSTEPATGACHSVLADITTAKGPTEWSDANNRQARPPVSAHVLLHLELVPSEAKEVLQSLNFPWHLLSEPLRNFHPFQEVLPAALLERARRHDGGTARDSLRLERFVTPTKTLWAWAACTRIQTWQWWPVAFGWMANLQLQRLFHLWHVKRILLFSLVHSQVKEIVK